EFNRNDEEARKRIESGLRSWLVRADNDATEKEYRDTLSDYQERTRRIMNEYFVEEGRDAVITFDRSPIRLAAIAQAVRISVPVTFLSNGQPVGSTWIAHVPNPADTQQIAQKLFNMCHSYEQNFPVRKPPVMKTGNAKGATTEQPFVENSIAVSPAPD